MSEQTDLLVAVQHPDVNMDDYVHKAYLIPSQVGGCGWGGVAYVGTCANGVHAYCKAWIRTSSAQVLAHELGHNVGTVHAADDFNDDGTQGAEYGDYTDVMGRAMWASMNGETYYCYFFSPPARTALSLHQHGIPRRAASPLVWALWK